MAQSFGHIRVNKLRITKPNIQYATLLSEDTLVFARIGGHLADVAGGGWVCPARSARGSSNKAQQQEFKANMFMDAPADEILRQNNDNFQILSSTIDAVEVKKSSYNWKF